ncbi:phosphosulfolactate synthase [Acidobacteriota bacterium]
MSKAWDGVITIPLAGRSNKPRKSGITMVIDKGMGIARTNDLIATAGDYIDIIKLTFGTSAFYNTNLLKEKNALLIDGGLDVMPGGTFLEVTVWQKNFDEYLIRAKNLGFNTIEVSDGTIEMDDSTRTDTIKRSLDAGFKVVTEVGKKDPKEAISIQQTHDTIKRDLEDGAFKVIIEAREAGKGVGIFDKEGQIKQDELDQIASGVDDVYDLVWEAPIKNQQQSLIMRWGPEVNLGNIPADDILALEALRQGLRGDTLKKAYMENKNWTS